MIPNDSYYGNQWHLDSISAPSAWNLTTGSPSIKLAIIDTGVDAAHPDLGYGYDTYRHVSTTEGYNYTTNSTYSTPVYNHGTIVAGVAGAKSNNTIGVAGVAGGNHNAGITILSYCVGNSNSFDPIYFDDAIIDAVDDGAQVINISFSMASNDYIDSAIEYAYNHGVLIVCASGNNNDEICYPASHPYTIAVGSINQNNERANFSNYGALLDIVAPGVNIYTTDLNNDYGYYGGTSLSAPQVAATIALMLSVNSMLTLTQIRGILHNTANKVSGYNYDIFGHNDEVGYGRLNVYEALKAADVIVGEHQLCGPEIYNISNLPNDVSVDWSFLKNPSNNNLIQQNYPYQNQCIINIDNFQTINDTLCATFAHVNTGAVIGKVKKAVSTGWNFYGTYQVREKHTLNLVDEGSITANSFIGIDSDKNLIISSPFFSGSLISYNTTGNAQHIYFNGAITISFSESGETVVINGASLNDCNNFKIRTFCLYSLGLSFNPLLTLSDNQLTISLEQQEQDTSRPISWSVNVMNAFTGQKVYNNSFDGKMANIDISSWKRGTYIVKSRMENREVSQKVVIK